MGEGEHACYPPSSNSICMTACLNSILCKVSVSSVQSLSRVQLFVTPWTAACQASLSITNSQSLLKLMSIESLIRSNHLILYYPLLLLPSIFPSIRVFSKELVLHIRWPNSEASASASVLPVNIQDCFPLGWTGQRTPDGERQGNKQNWDRPGGIG